MRRITSNIESTSFLSDPWLGDDCLRIKFICIFYLCVDSSVTVAEMRKHGWGLMD